MICPKCQRSLRAKERTGNTCSFCRTRFALDPRTNSLRLHDLKLRRAVHRLTDEGKVPCTVTQLWYALAAREPYAWERSLRGHRVEPSRVEPSWARSRPSGRKRLDPEGFLIPFVLGTALILSGTVLLDPLEWGLVILGSLFVVGGVTAAVKGRGPRRRAARRRRAAVSLRKRHPRPASLVKTSLETFRWEVIDRWRSTHGSLPKGLVDDTKPVAVERVGRPRLALYCEDAAVVALLAAHGVPRRHRLVLASAPGQLPADIPVAVLHDASVAGCQLADGLRATFPGWLVFDAGLSPRLVIGRAQQPEPRHRPIMQQTHRPSQTQRQRLRALGTLTQEEYAWLASGWWAPLAGVRPRPLLAAVERAIEATLAAERAHRAAEPAGFLTSP